MNKNTGNTASTSFKLPRELLERLQKRAKENDLSMAQAIRRAIVFWLELANLKETGVSYDVQNDDAPTQ